MATKLDVSALAADYQSGLSLRRVASKYGTSSANVRYLFTTRGIPTRSKSLAQTGDLSHRLKHGHATGGAVTPEYQSWTAMWVRCENPHHPAFHNYGGRGISVCAKWRESFAAFLADMGPRPPKDYSIDRIDNNGNYEPGNCRWATRREQALNRRPRPRA